MSTLEIFVALLRGAHVAALVSLFGTLLFLVVVAPPAMAEAVTAAARLRLVLLRLARISAACALIVGLAWLTLESAVIAGADSASMTLHVLPVVALQTQFGQWLTVRLGLLLVVFSLLCALPLATVAATVLAAAALAIQPMLGHAGAIGGSVGIELIISETLHLLAAGAWLGGLLPLFIALGILPHEQAATACRNFTPIGLAAVLILAGTAVVQVAEFMGGLPGLFGTGYGHVALVKLGLFVVLLTLAGLNRLVFTDRLAGTASLAARRHMRLSVATEAVLGVLVVITAGFLASHAPGTHEQPVWPFPWRPSLDALYEPFLQQEVIPALIAAIGAVAIAVIGLLWRRIRWPALAASVVILVLAVPHLDLLFVEAFPTSFYTSPTEFAATAIVHGGKLFAANCTSCHGADGQGDGPAAQSLPIRPADLTAEHLWAHSDGEMYWYISHGFEAPQGGITMPGFVGSLSSEGRWDLIDYLRAHNAGESMRKSGKWPHPLPVPQFDAECAGGRTIDLDDLRGSMLRIIAASDEAQVEPVSLPGMAVTTIIVTPTRDARPTPSTCIASEPETWTAFAILLGVAPDALAGAQILVDQNAWLRAAWRPGDPGDWTNPQLLEAEIRDIVAHPIAITASAHVHHH
jgi:putative copper export protein/mono/diheme cytochrome c family protein